MPGVTFGMSPMLREHWEVVEVIKPKLLPNDKFILTVIQNYSDVFSYRNMQALQPYIPINTPEVARYSGEAWQSGDLGLLLSFSGDKANCTYSTADGSQVYNQSMQHAPARISIVSESSIEYRAMQDFDPDTGAKVTAMQETTVREAEDADMYFSAKHDDSHWSVLVASNLTYKSRTTKVDEST